MNTRMDKYKNIDNIDDIPKRSDKYKELYHQIYNAYDEFENLIIPSNSREINISEYKREIGKREDYQKNKEINNKIESNNNIIRKEKLKEIHRKENEIYDIKELLNKAVNNNKEDVSTYDKMTDEKYLKKLNMEDIDRDNTTNIEIIKDIYNEQKKELDEEIEENNEDLLQTANLSLDILSDLKGDNDSTRVSAPIKEDEIPDNVLQEEDFYSNQYKFNKKDFEKKEDFYDNEMKEKRGSFILKTFIIIFCISITITIIIILFKYLNRV